MGVVALSESTTSLLAALLGALVGGAASLAGSIVVSRWSRSSEARLRLYDELVPAAMTAYETLSMVGSTIGKFGTSWATVFTRCGGRASLPADENADWQTLQSARGSPCAVTRSFSFTGPAVRIRNRARKVNASTASLISSKS